MQTNRAAALAYIDQDEGPEVNVSSGEPGGISCRGVSLTVLQEYNKAHGLPAATFDSVRAMTADLAGKVYSWRFLDPIRFDELPAGIDYRMADCAITLGLTGVAVVTQMALLMWPVTGRIDDDTLKAIKGDDPHILLAALDAAWLTWKHSQGDDAHAAKGWKDHGHGWTNRVRNVHGRALALMGAQRSTS